MNRKIVMFVEFAVSVEFDYQPPERADQTYPGCDAEIEVTEVKLAGVSILDKLTPAQLDTIEQECWDSLGEPE